MVYEADISIESGRGEGLFLWPPIYPIYIWYMGRSIVYSRGSQRFSRPGSVNRSAPSGSVARAESRKGKAGESSMSEYVHPP